MSKAKELVKKWMQEAGLQPDDVTLDTVTRDFESKYNASAGATKKALEAPYTSTQQESLQGYREFGEIEHDQNKKNLGLVQDQVNILAGARGTKLNQDSDFQQRSTDTHTAAAMQLLGGSQREIQADGYASKDQGLQRITDYQRSFDDKYLGTIRDMHKAEMNQANMGFVKDLVGTAIMLGM